MKTGLRSNPTDPIERATASRLSGGEQDRPPTLNPQPRERRPGDRRSRFWPRCGSRLIEWASQRTWLGGSRRRDQPEALEPFSGLRRLKESPTYKELQALVDHTQAAPDGPGVHQLVDLALFSESEPNHAT